MCQSCPVPGVLRANACDRMILEGEACWLRVRVCREESGALFLRVEAAPEAMERVLACREALQAEGAARGYRWVTLDLGGYRMGGGVS